MHAASPHARQGTARQDLLSGAVHVPAPGTRVATSPRLLSPAVGPANRCHTVASGRITVSRVRPIPRPPLRSIAAEPRPAIRSASPQARSATSGRSPGDELDRRDKGGGVGRDRPPSLDDPSQRRTPSTPEPRTGDLPPSTSPRPARALHAARTHRRENSRLPAFWPTSGVAGEDALGSASLRVCST
jgi:hypothetical protein